MKTKAVSILLAVLIAVCSLNSTAFADWYDDVKSGTTWVEIEGDEFVVDTFCGVEARYNKSDYYYQCNELIMRFYREAYGLNMRAYAAMEMYINGQLVSSAEGPQMVTQGYTFKKTDTAKVGDIIFVSAEMRDSGSDHWAIVKEIGGGYITMFEQNVLWEGKAALNRKIKYPSDSYYIYTPVSTTGGPAPVLKNAAGTAEESEAAATEKQSTEETVTTAETTAEKQTTTKKITTTKPTTTKTTTTKPTTTKKVTTTKKPTTTRKVTTTKAVTTTKPTTTTVPETTTEVSTTAEETTTEWYYTYTYTSQQTELQTESSVEYTEVQNEESNKATLPLAIVCGVLACGVAALVVLLIKKKK